MDHMMRLMPLSLSLSQSGRLDSLTHTQTQRDIVSRQPAAGFRAAAASVWLLDWPSSCGLWFDLFVWFMYIYWKFTACITNDDDDDAGLSLCHCHILACSGCCHMQICMRKWAALLDCLPGCLADWRGVGGMERGRGWVLGVTAQMSLISRPKKNINVYFSLMSLLKGISCCDACKKIQKFLKKRNFCYLWNRTRVTFFYAINIYTFFGLSQNLRLLHGTVTYTDMLMQIPLHRHRDRERYPELKPDSAEAKNNSGRRRLAAAGPQLWRLCTAIAQSWRQLCCLNAAAAKEEVKDRSRKQRHEWSQTQAVAECQINNNKKKRWHWARR